MKYCKNCLMPDTRPGIKFDEQTVCSACINFDKRKTTDWDSRWEELKKICDKHTLVAANRVQDWCYRR